MRRDCGRCPRWVGWLSASHFLKRSRATGQTQLEPSVITRAATFSDAPRPHTYMPAPAPAPARPALAAAAAAAAAGPSGAADDLFDSALNLEESHIQEGHEEGLR